MNKNHDNDAFLFLARALNFVQKERVAAQVRKSHLEKNKKACDLTEGILKRAVDFEDWLNQEMKRIVKEHPANHWFSNVKGIGDLNIGKVLAYVDIKEASTVSKLWRYAGFGCINGAAERMAKGEKLHFNKALKSMCWRLAKSLIRAKGAYYKFYCEEKKQIIEKKQAEGLEVVPAAQIPRKKGKLVEGENGYFSLGHADMMAMRKMIKLFLAHLWQVWREAEGLETTKPYAHTILGHTNVLHPWDFIERKKSQILARNSLLGSEPYS